MEQEATMRLMWVLPILGAVAGAGMLALTLTSASGAPQEAAGAAIACAAAVIPYVLARAVDALRGHGEEG